MWRYRELLTDADHASKRRFRRAGVLPYGTLDRPRDDHPGLRFPWAQVREAPQDLAGVTGRGDSVHLAGINPSANSPAAAARRWAIETSGAAPAATAALKSVDIWGKVCDVGLGSTSGFDVRAFLGRRINIMTSYSMSSIGQMACADFVVERKLDLDRLFTHRRQLDPAELACTLFDQPSSGKGAIVC